MPTFPFEFISPPKYRSLEKPRRSGLTSAYDYGVPLDQQRDILRTAGNWIDFVKVVSASPRITPEDVLREKLRAFEAAQCHAYMGGQIFEYVLTQLGIDGVARLFDEAARIGFGALELSDTVIDLAPDIRARCIDMANERGLEVLVEIGGVYEKQAASVLIEDIKRCFADGAAYAIVEGMELMTAEGPRADVIAALREEVPTERVFLEVPWIGYAGVIVSGVVALKQSLIAELGPDVNLANIQLNEVIELEGMRQEIEFPELWGIRSR